MICGNKSHSHFRDAPSYDNCCTCLLHHSYTDKAHKYNYYNTQLLLKSCALPWKFFAIFDNPEIFSAMAMAKHAIGTLCVLVFCLKISLLEMLIAVGNDHLKMMRMMLYKERIIGN